MSGFNSVIPTLGGSSFIGPSFFPSNVPEIRDGYWWSTGATVGIGTTGFRVIEQNGHSSIDFVQPTIASQPTILTEAGGIQFRMRNAANPNPSLMGSIAFQAGWTGATYIGGWFRFPSGVTGLAGSLFQHTQQTGNQGRISFALGTSGLVLAVNQTGSSLTNNVYAGSIPILNTFAWLWCEALFIGSGATDADRGKVFINLNEMARTGGLGIGASIFNGLAPAGPACRLQAGLANIDTTDWAAVYYGNGIPNLANRKLLANFYNPSGVLLT